MDFDDKHGGPESRVYPVLAALVFSAVFVSCTEFFATSLAPWAARNPGDLIPPVTSGNVAELVAGAEQDPDLSMAVLEGIQKAVGSASESGKTALRGAALDAAANAIGGATAIVDKLGSVSSVDSVEDAKEFVLNALAGMRNLDSASTSLAGILPPPPADPFHPDGDFLAYTESAPVGDLALAAVIIVAGEVNRTGGSDFENYYDNIDNYPSENLPEDLAVALAISAAISERADELTGPMRTMLEGMNLVPGMIP